MAAGEAVEEIKSMVQRTVKDGFGKIGILPSLGGLTIGLTIGETKMPFADHPGGVAAVPKEFRERGAFAFDEWVTMDAEENPAFEVSSPAIATGEEGISTRRAATGGRVGVGEANAIGRQLFESGRVKLGAVGIAGPSLIGAGVTHTHVIGKEDHDVGNRVGVPAIQNEQSEANEKWFHDDGLSVPATDGRGPGFWKVGAKLVEEGFGFFVAG